MKFNLSTYIISFLLFGLFVAPNVMAQEINLRDYRIRFRFKTIKQPDQSRMLEASFIAANKKDRKDRLPVYGAEISFFNVLEEEKVALGTAKTSKEGIAHIILPKDQSYLTDKEGKFTLRAVFAGTDEMKRQEREISTKDVQLSVELAEKDSVQTVQVNAHTLDSLGVAIPLEEADVIVSVQGMLSRMVMDEGTIEDGTYEFKMPGDLPGDVDGNMTVFAIIEDHDDYGDVVQKKTVEWEVPNSSNQEDKNSLWSEVAPIWMYVVLTILLVGIWGNFAYTITNLFKIKKEGQKLKTEPMK